MPVKEDSKNNITSLLAFRRAANTQADSWVLRIQPGENRAEVYGKRLFDAAKCNDLDAMAVLIVNGADVNFMGGVQMTPLLYAGWNGSDEACDLLISSGRCDYTIRDAFDEYASDLAFSPGNNFDLSERLFDLELAQAKEKGITLYFDPNIKLLDLN